MSTPSDRYRTTQGQSRGSYASGHSPYERSSGDYGRPSGQRPSGGYGRPAGQRTPDRYGRSSSPQRPTGQRPDARRPSSGQRPPYRRGKRPQNRFYVILAVAILLVIVSVVFFVGKNSGSKDTPVVNNNVATVAAATVAPEAAEGVVVSADNVAESADGAADVQTATGHSEALSQMLASDEGPVEGLTAEQMANVTDLSMNQGLPEEWMNILLLGSDERYITESARTDTMMICSINMNTGEVKLTSIMRDLAVNFDDIGKYNGTYRINAANYFGGENLAMKTVNECFGMNIDRYVRVNFYGFQQVVHLLGGIDIDITEAEMNEINYWIVDAALDAYYQGIDESNLPREKLESYGPNTHLDGRQALAYARIRKIDSDYARAERQRTVLTALMNKLKGAGAGDLLAIGTEAMNHFKTNMTLDEILAVAVKVCSSGLNNVESFRLPVNDTYVQEKRNNDEMFYDCDWSANSRELYNFIYT